ncbi:MAG: TRAP transporter small permease [Pseudomonadota bacterium]
MTDSVSVHTDNSLLSRADQWLHKLETGLALCSGLAIFSLMVFAVVSVVGRALFDQPLPGYVDWIEQMMPLVAMLGIAYTQRHGGHIRMDLVIGRLHGRLLWLFECLTSLAILVLVVFLIWGAWAHFSRSFDWAAPWWSRDSSMDIGIPLWPAKLLIPVALTSLGLRVMLQIGSFFKALIHNADRPVAVPLSMDHATQASTATDFTVQLHQNPEKQR